MCISIYIHTYNLCFTFHTHIYICMFCLYIHNPCDPYLLAGMNACWMPYGCPVRPAGGRSGSYVWAGWILLVLMDERNLQPCSYIACCHQQQVHFVPWLPVAHHLASQASFWAATYADIELFPSHTIDYVCTVLIGDIKKLLNLDGVHKNVIRGCAWIAFQLHDDFRMTMIQKVKLRNSPLCHLAHHVSPQSTISDTAPGPPGAAAAAAAAAAAGDPPIARSEVLATFRYSGISVINLWRWLQQIQQRIAMSARPSHRHPQVTYVKVVISVRPKLSWATLRCVSAIRSLNNTITHRQIIYTYIHTYIYIYIYAYYITWHDMHRT